MNIKLNYKKVKIQDVQKGDYIKSYSIEKDLIEPQLVEEILRPIVEKEDQLRIDTENGYIINSTKHPMLVKREGKYVYVKSKNLEIGDEFLTSENKKEFIKSITKPDLDTQFYDLTVAKNNNFFAGYKTLYCGHNSSTTYKNFYSMEIESWLVWGNNKGTETTRERDTDYCVVWNELFFKRYKNNEDITLFFANDVPRLSSFMGNDEEFTKLYEHYEKTVPKRKQKKISAEKIYNQFLNERFLQARLYCIFAENLSGRSSFKVPIKTSNLCLKGDSKINILIGDKELLIDIEDVGSYLEKHDGVKVLSRDNKNKVNEYKEITDFALMDESADLLRITDEETGNFIECTEDHKVWTENRGYVKAKDLVTDDTVIIKL